MSLYFKRARLDMFPFDSAHMSVELSLMIDDKKFSEVSIFPESFILSKFDMIMDTLGTRMKNSLIAYEKQLKELNGE